MPHHFMAAVDIDVNYVAHLARLSLSPEEAQKLGAQLAHVLGYIEKLREVDVSGIAPTAHAFPLVNVTRPDVVQPSMDHEEVVRNAPSTANGLFMVPKIVE
jgi:aspartyl-tRNA(Asn)/glutamyl-tRNA(Gln) amidotransferase subunit C